MALAWKDWLKESISVGGTGTLTLGGAVSGYQAFAAGDDALIFPYSIQDGTAWETGYGTYTHSGTTFARTSRTASSTGSALNVTTGGFLFVDLVSNVAQGMDAAAQGVIPGGRLTVTSATPVKQPDGAGANNVYYTPYTSNVISLWDGNRWAATLFSEVTQALGTLTDAKPYDVFGYLSAGALNTEMLAWTNDTTRATDVTIQDGRYCKSGDKTRLLLGSFYTTSTTTTEDSKLNRYLSNVYNRVPATCKTGAQTTQNHTYGTATWREWNNGTSVVRANWMETLPVTSPLVSGLFELAGSGTQTAYGSINVDTTTDDPDESVGNISATALRLAMVKGGGSLTNLQHGNIAAGKHYATPMEYASGGSLTFSYYWVSVFIQR